ncbi:MAG: PRC-barrel domain-containing protein [Candidatus Angelobacter sp.]
MPHYGILREYKFEDLDDVRGADVYGVNDEKLGTIEDVVFNHSNGEIRYVVLNTGGLFSRKKVMVPAGRIGPYGNHEDKFYAELDKERLEMLPEFNDEMLKSEQDWSSYEKEHEKRWNEGSVMYNKDTGRVVTPPLDQVEATRRGPLSEAAKSSLNRDFTPQKMGQQDDYLGVASGAKATLRPRKASMGGKEDVAAIQKGREQPREVMGPIGSEIEIPKEGSRAPVDETVGEPGIYKLDAVPEAEKKSDLNEALNANYGRRWIGFQESLRSRRDKVVGNCPLCGSQDKAA